MQLYRKLPICLLDLQVGRGRRHLECVVVGRVDNHGWIRCNSRKGYQEEGRVKRVKVAMAGIRINGRQGKGSGGVVSFAGLSRRFSQEARTSS